MDIGPAVGVKKWCEAKANTQRSMGAEYCGAFALFVAISSKDLNDAIKNAAPRYRLSGLKLAHRELT